MIIHEETEFKKLKDGRIVMRDIASGQEMFFNKLEELRELNKNISSFFTRLFFHKMTEKTLSKRGRKERKIGANTDQPVLFMNGKTSINIEEYLKNEKDIDEMEIVS